MGIALPLIHTKDTAPTYALKKVLHLWLTEIITSFLVIRFIIPFTRTLFDLSTTYINKTHLISYPIELTASRVNVSYHCMFFDTRTISISPTYNFQHRCSHRIRQKNIAPSIDINKYHIIRRHNELLCLPSTQKIMEQSYAPRQSQHPSSTEEIPQLSLTQGTSHIHRY